MSKIQKVFTLDQAKKLAVIPGVFVIIDGYTPVTQGWKNSEGSSLPEEIKAYKKKDRPVVIIKIAKNKTKIYAFPLGKAFCTEKDYYQALAMIR
jgi:hypothetical protein